MATKKLPTRKLGEIDVYLKVETGRAPREYIFIHGQRIFLHTYLAQTYIRPLVAGEVVHHRDGNPLNNELSNLEIMTRREHIRHHTPVAGYKFTIDQKKRLSDAHMGHVPWNKGMQGFKHTSESRANMSAAQKGRKITWGAKITAAKTKVTKSQLLGYLKNHPNATLVEVKAEFSLKSNMPIQKHGGLRRLRREAK